MDNLEHDYDQTLLPEGCPDCAKRAWEYLESLERHCTEYFVYEKEEPSHELVIEQK
jgi:hypothetical protein